MNQSKELLRQQLELLAEHSEGATEQLRYERCSSL